MGVCATADLACDLADAGVTKDVENGSAPARHYVPFLVLFRGYWAAMLLQVVYEACEYLPCGMRGVKAGLCDMSAMGAR
jgi:hypothetical protein